MQLCRRPQAMVLADAERRHLPTPDATQRMKTAARPGDKKRATGWVPSAPRACSQPRPRRRRDVVARLPLRSGFGPSAFGGEQSLGVDGAATNFSRHHRRWPHSSSAHLASTRPSSQVVLVSGLPSGPLGVATLRTADSPSTDTTGGPCRPAAASRRRQPCHRR